MTTAVPRQEDIGVDFYCQLAENETGILTFNHPFVVSAKSDSTYSVVFGEKDPNKWRNHQIDWLSKIDWPLIFAFVNKGELSLSLYTTSMFRFLEFNNKHPSIIEFIRRRSFEPNQPIHSPEEEILVDWPTGKGDGIKYKIDLGNPLITLRSVDFDDPITIIAKKHLLRRYLELEQQNIVFKKLSIPYFQWPKCIWTNVRFEENWFHLTLQNPNFLERVINYLGPGFISLAINLKVNNRDDLIEHVKPFLKELPSHMFSDQLRQDFPYLFD